METKNEKLDKIWGDVFSRHFLRPKAEPKRVGIGPSIEKKVKEEADNSRIKFALDDIQDVCPTRTDQKSKRSIATKKGVNHISPKGKEMITTISNSLDQNR